MNEQELRAAVAEYDAKLAESMIYDAEAGLHGVQDFIVEVNWVISPTRVEIEAGCVVLASDVIQSHAATMRAMGGKPAQMPRNAFSTKDGRLRI